MVAEERAKQALSLRARLRAAGCSSVAWLAVFCSVTSSSRAQTGVFLRDDNDVFNFWKPVEECPDAGYTQRFHAGLILPGKSPLRLWWLGRAPACSAARTTDQLCSRLALSLGQEIYNPWRDARQLIPGERPYAGWLFVRAELRNESNVRLDALSVVVGVTGPPSLAEEAQRLVHDLGGYRQPLGWDGQLKFEPGVMVRYQGARQVASVAQGGFGASVTPVWTFDAGAIANRATLGAHFLIGLRPPPPWEAPRSSASRKVAAFIRASAEGSLVLTDLFLDGGVFRDGPSVQKNRLVCDPERCSRTSGITRA